MLSEQPEVAGAGDRSARRVRFGVGGVLDRRGRIRIRLVARGLFGAAGNRAVARLGCQRIKPGQQPLDFSVVEAS